MTPPLPAMKILAIDIELTPCLAHVWQLWDVTVHLPQLIESASMLCFAARFLGERKIHFYSVHHDGREKMVQAAWNLLNEADALLTYNGKQFDGPHLNREFIELGMPPPSPGLRQSSMIMRWGRRSARRLALVTGIW